MKHHLLLGLLLLILLSACGTHIPVKAATNQNQAETSDLVVARINDLEFTQSELEQEFAIDRVTYKLTNNKELVLQDLEGTLQGLIPTLLLDQQAQQAGFSASDEEVTVELINFVAGRMVTIDDLEVELERQNVTLADFRHSLTRNVRIQKYLNQVFPPDTEEEVDFAAWLRELRENATIEVLYAPPQQLPLMGAIAPDFVLTSFKGDTVSLSQFRGRPVVINFWATWCVPCRREMPAFQQALETYQEDGLIVLAVNFEEEANLVRPFVEEFDLTFEILFDTQAEVSQTYLVTGLPHTVFVDRQGIIRHIQVGEVKQDMLEEFLDQIL
jgi:peroxiredoxin